MKVCGGEVKGDLPYVKYREEGASNAIPSLLDKTGLLALSGNR